MSDVKQPRGGAPQIQIKIDDAVALGRYSNLVLINHTENEFILDFALLQPGQPVAVVLSRIVSSPKHTKRLIKALQHNIEHYEKRFGEIATDTEEMVH